jgi:glycosyltransferase involved in cell wall biosynthesis
MIAKIGAPMTSTSAPTSVHGSADHSGLRVAIACTGVGQVKRGFERYFADLHRVLDRRIDITLYKGGGRSTGREKRIRCMSRVGWLHRILPLHRLMGRTPYHTECLTFVLQLYPRIRMGGYDVVHCIDPPVARLMFWMRRAFGGKFRLLYTEGCAMPPADYPPADYVHHVAMQAYMDANAHGYAADDMTMIPCGIASERFVTSKSREELRREHCVPLDMFVILSVAAINRTQKRIDYLIDEVAQLDGDGHLLWLDGSFDHGDPTLLDYGRDVLGARMRFTHVPSDRVGELYRLADLMVLASVNESFSLSVAEAMIAGTRVLAHDSPHFRWLVKDESMLVDMREPGALAARLAVLRDQHHAAAHAPDQMAVNAGRARARFDWRAVAPQYMDLYKKVKTLPQADYRLNAGAASRPCPESSSASPR